MGEEMEAIFFEIGESSDSYFRGCSLQDPPTPGTAPQNGYGIHKNSKGKVIAVGQWKNGELDGIGKMCYENKNVDKEFKEYDEYIGQWKGGKRHGRGVLTIDICDDDDDD